MMSISRMPKSIWYTSQLVRVICAINLLFWIWLWLDVIHNVHPFTDRVQAFEEIMPVYKFGSYAIPAKADHEMITLKTMRVIHQPAYFAVVRVANRVSDGSWDQRWGSLSIGSFVLIATMLLSFLQWGIVAWLAWNMIQRFK
jgi:hypothetical protein